MKNLSTTLLLLLAINFSFGQKLGIETDKLKLKYLAPAVFDEDSPTHFTVDVHRVVLKEDASKPVSKGQLTSSSKYFWNKRLVKAMESISPATFLNGVEAPANSKVGKIVVEMGEPVLDSTHATPTSNTNSVTGATTTYWKAYIFYKVTASINFLDENGASFFEVDYSGPGEFGVGKSSFPGMNGTFSSKSEALEVCKKYPWAGLNRCADVNLSSIIQDFRYKVNDVEKDRTLKTTLLTHQMKGKGKGKEKFDGLLAIEERFDVLLGAIQKEIKSGSNMNWHTEPIQKEAKEILAAYSKIVTDDQFKDKEEELLTELYSTHVFMNIAWLYNFTGKYDKALEVASMQVAAFRKKRIPQTDGNWPVFPGDWNAVINFASSYPAIFKVGAKKYGWK